MLIGEFPREHIDDPQLAGPAGLAHDAIQAPQGVSVQKDSWPEEARARVPRRWLGVKESGRLAGKVLKNGGHRMDDPPSPAANFLPKAGRNLARVKLFWALQVACLSP
jgi:hypothetical protein